MRLVICGNGFDIHHHLKTNYEDYKSFLAKYNPELLRQFESFPYFPLEHNAQLWKNLEQALAIDYEELMDRSMQYYPEAMEEGDCKWWRMQIDVELLTSFVHQFTGSCFAIWLRGESQRIPYLKPDLDLSTNDLYINFNYTDTLQTVYRIPDDHVFHIHGKLLNVENVESDSQVRKELQFGAVGISAKTVERELTKVYNQTDYFYVSIKPAIVELCDFIKKTSKNLKSNYEALHLFLNDREINEVVVMGHSLTGADISYYQDILVPRFKSVKWTFMRHKNGDEIDSFITEFGIEHKTIDW